MELDIHIDLIMVRIYSALGCLCVLLCSHVIVSNTNPPPTRTPLISADTSLLT